VLRLASGTLLEDRPYLGRRSGSRDPLGTGAFRVRERWLRLLPCGRPLRERIIELVGITDREKFRSYLGIASRDPRVSLEYGGDSASISIPYWYDGEQAVSVVTTA
jgi:hypothetical protein